ncbi:hypothetical protein FRB95_006574 [Tulasnella sp. JGI-2019a]|nr:hypothetical protein FRB95_006574 [Tulasnella sp. JGI-2019a]
MIQRSIEIESRETPNVNGCRSILGTLVGVSRAIYDRRREIYVIYWSGTLQEALGVPVRPAPPIPRPVKYHYNEGYPSLTPGSATLAVLPESKVVASDSQPMADEGRRKRTRSPSVELADHLEDSEGASLQRASGDGEEGDDNKDSRFKAIRPGQRKRTSAIGVVFMSVDEASEDVRVVTNVRSVSPGSLSSSHALFGCESDMEISS